MDVAKSAVPVQRQIERVGGPVTSAPRCARVTGGPVTSAPRCARVTCGKDEGLVNICAGASLAEVYSALPDVALLVEPLSATEPLARFLASGGVGFGSIRHGTFAGQVCRVKSALGGVDFAYGLGRAPLYNVGYPLHRIMEGRTEALTGERFEAPSEIVLRTRERAPVVVDWTPSETCELPSLDGAENVLYVNGPAARAMGLGGAGKLVARKAPPGARESEAWARRFLLDSLPRGHVALVLVTQTSEARALHDAHRAASPEGVFAALAVHMGVLIVASGPAAAAEDLWKKASARPLTWRVAPHP